MTARGWGRIINISGLAARSVSTASGSIRNVAVAALTKTLADELGPHGVNVTVVHPGWTVTERTGDQIAAYASARGITEAVAQVMLARDISIGRPSPPPSWPTSSPSSPRPAASPSTATRSPPSGHPRPHPLLTTTHSS